MKRTCLAAALACILFLPACGYHVSGKGSRLPAGLHTISIPGFINQTQTYRIEHVLTEAVVKEFTTRTTYRIVHDENEPSDAILRGTVTSAQLAPLTYDSQTGRASSALVTVNIKVTLVDRNGRVLFDNPNYSFREQYQVSREVSSFFEEQSPAMDRLSRDFARTLVSSILEAF